ncbi:hypothetical protein C8Q72DRAFT_90092 [Fomitopsis betulina]|nr:hypothetical protein C8Q72DRAFT_90092 [Fomitopsis betulina]
MALARGLDNFYLADGSVMLSTHEYLWPRAKIVPVSTSIGSTDNHETALLSPSIKPTDKTTSASTAPPVDWVDLVPLIACGLFLSVLIAGMLLAPSTRLKCSLLQNNIAPVDGKQCDDDLEADMAQSALHAERTWRRLPCHYVQVFPCGLRPIKSMCL